MSTNRIFFILLAVFLILYGLFAVTNFKVEWGATIMGYSALIAGIVGIIAAVQNKPPTG